MTYWLYTDSSKAAIERVITDSAEIKDTVPYGYANKLLCNRHDLKSFEDAERVASMASQAMGHLYLATDAGAHVHPRYDVIKAPMLGDEISYGFNGDYYPCGRILKISKDFRIITTDELRAKPRRFYRRGKSAQWLEGGTWALVRGRRDERNPHL